MEARLAKRGRTGILGAVAWIVVAAFGLRLACVLAAPGFQAVSGLSNAGAGAVVLAGFAASLAALAAGRD